MFKNNGNTAISRYLLFSVCVLCLMFTSFGLMVEDSYAVDLNESSDAIEVEYDIEDNIQNSQQNDEILEVEPQEDESLQQDLEEDDDVEVLKSDSQPNDNLGVKHEVRGNKFSDIANAISSAKEGDTIDLKSSIYYAENEKSRIWVDKAVTITSSANTVLDGKGMSYCFNIRPESPGTIISNLKFVNCWGDIGCVVYVNAQNVTIDNCVFENNHANRGGAVITKYDLESTKNFKIKNCNFTNNTGYYDNFANYSSVGALAVYGTNSEVINCIFDSNWVKGDGDSYGGAIQAGLDLPGSYVKISGCTFKNNKAISISGSSHGGAGCLREGTEYIDCVFINNEADMGGAITMHSSGSIVNCKFYNNTAVSNYGGAVSTGFLYDHMEMTIDNCIFEGNSAPEGGAIQAKGENVNIINSNFKNNYANKYGGAISIVAEDVNVKNSKFNSNVAEINGGAIYINGKNTVVQDSSFISNQAIPHSSKMDDGLGGAIYVNSTYATIKNNEFKFNTARNGSAIYYDKDGEKLTMIGNTLYQNQAWVYKLPIYTEDIHYTESEDIKVVLYGGNNIADYDNLAVSNAIYNAADNNKIEIDGEFPLDGATMSGELYQDDREYHIVVLLTVQHEDGTVVFNKSLNTNYLGEINVNLDNLKEGKYYVSAQHFEDTYYKGITNVTSFRVIPRVDNKISKSVKNSTCNYEDIVVWTLTISNEGPSNSTGVVAYDVLPDGLSWIDDTSGGKYNHRTGKIDVGFLAAGETFTFDIMTVVEKTGTIVNSVNVTSNQDDEDLSNNHDERTITVNKASDLSVRKSADNTNPYFGDVIYWTIEVSNNGPDEAHNVKVTDVIPKGLTYMETDGNYNPNSGIWTIGTLPSGEKVKLSIKCRVDSLGFIQNNASVTGSEYDFDLSNNDVSAFINGNPTCDLSVVKSVNATTVNYGEFLKWTIVVSNNGVCTATNVKVQDVLPEGLIYCNSTSSKGSYSNGIFTIGSLKTNEKCEINIISKANATGGFTNYVNVSSDVHDVDLTNNYAYKGIAVNSAADLSVAKSVDEKNPDNGEEVTWTISVTNAGPDAAHEIAVLDKLPSSLIWISDSSSGKYDPKTGVWSIDQLNNGDTITLEIVCQVNGSGQIQNNVSVSAKEYDYNSANNNASETIDVEKSAEISLVKSVDNPNHNYGDIVTWTLVISNKGPDRGSDLYVEDILPEGLILINSTATKGFYDEGRWVRCCLDPGQTETLIIVCKVNKTGTITNFASVDANENDPDLSNNNASVSIEVPPTVDLKVTMKVNNTNPAFGDAVNWMISVKNNGPDMATDVVLTDVLPNGVTFSNYKSSKGSYNSNKWNIGSLNAGETQYLNITSLSNALGKITNNAEVKSAQNDWNMSNNKDSSQINVSPLTDLSISKSVDNQNPNYGDVIKWTLIATNEGPNDATNVLVQDKLPKGLTFVSSTGNYKNGVWTVGKLSAGESKEIEIVCKITSTSEITNIASISGDENDPNSDNNQAEESVSINPVSDLSISKVASKYYYAVGDVIQYVIEVVNNGPDTATNVKINESFDDSLQLNSFKATSGNFNKNSNIWKIESLKVGESAKLTLQFIATAQGIIENAVSVSNDNMDNDLTNNKDTCKVNVTEKSSDLDELLDKIAKSGNSNALSQLLNNPDVLNELSKLLNSPDDLNKLIELLNNEDVSKGLSKLLNDPDSLSGLINLLKNSGASKGLAKLLNDPDSLSGLIKLLKNSGASKGLSKLLNDPDSLSGLIKLLKNSGASKGLGKLLNNPDSLNGLINLLKNPSSSKVLSKLLNSPDALNKLIKLLNNPSASKGLSKLFSNPDSLNDLAKILDNPSAWNKLVKLLNNPSKWNKLAKLLDKTNGWNKLSKVLESPDVWNKLAKLLNNPDDFNKVLKLLKSGDLDKLLKALDKYDSIDEVIKYLENPDDFNKMKILLDKYGSMNEVFRLLKIVDGSSYLSNGYNNGNPNDYSSLNNEGVNNLEKHKTANPLVALMLSLVFSVVFVRRQYFE